MIIMEWIQFLSFYFIPEKRSCDFGRQISA